MTHPVPTVTSGASNRGKFLIAVLGALLVVALTLGALTFFKARNTAARFESAVAQLEVNLSSAKETSARLGQSLLSAGVDGPSTELDGVQPGASSMVNELSATDLEVDAATLSDAKAQWDALSARIAAGDALLERVAESESKRALAEELETENSALETVSVSATQAADALDKAVGAALVEAALKEFSDARKALEVEIGAAQSVLEDSEGEVLDATVLDELSILLGEAQNLLEEDSDQAESGAQSGTTDYQAIVDGYRRVSQAMLSAADALASQCEEVALSVAEKAEAQRIAAAEAEAERIAAEDARLAAEQAEEDAANAANSDPVRSGSGCVWEPEDPETGWMPVWKLQGWCTEAEFDAAVGCARGWYPGCDDL